MRKIRNGLSTILIVIISSLLGVGLAFAYWVNTSTTEVGSIRNGYLRLERLQGENLWPNNLTCGKTEVIAEQYRAELVGHNLKAQLVLSWDSSPVGLNGFANLNAVQGDQRSQQAAIGNPISVPAVNGATYLILYSFIAPCDPGVNVDDIILPKHSVELRQVR